MRDGCPFYILGGVSLVARAVWLVSSADGPSTSTGGPGGRGGGCLWREGGGGATLAAALSLPK